ncbi:MAG: molecular chaperone DnaJ [Cyanobacteria bacterium P01_H01_bin.74]
MTTTPRDYYDILGVSKSANADEIKRAFRKKAKACHPDTNKSENAEAEFKELGEAYEVLSDPNKREIYNQYGHDGLKGRGYQPQYDFSEGFPDLSDLFSSFFGGGGFRQKNGPQQGNDLRVNIDLAFEEAVFGTKKDITFTHLVYCTPCDATGAAPGAGPSVCSTCGGQGQVRQTTQTIIGHFTQITTCPNCNGSGSVIVNPCRECHGKGRKPEESKRQITVPAGVDQGTRLRISGEGDVGVKKGPPGDLYVVLRVKSHQIFQRDGYNLYARREIDYSTLVLGGEINIETLESPETIKVPAGTQNGHIFTIRGRGVPYLNHSKKRGDLLLEVQVHIPKKVDGEQRKLLEKLSQISQKQVLKTLPKPELTEESGDGGGLGGLFGKFKTALSS